jgi:hypothetical protein
MIGCDSTTGVQYYNTVTALAVGSMFINFPIHLHASVLKAEDSILKLYYYYFFFCIVQL